MLGPFIRPEHPSPIVTPNPSSVFIDPILAAPVHWEALHTFNPAAIQHEGKIWILYRAEDNSGTMQIGMHTSRLGLASSTDGVHFTREPYPVFYPAKDTEEEREWPGGTEDPRIVANPNGGYLLTYTQWNRKTYRIGIATSPDLHQWTKHGPAFGMGKWAPLRYKSGGIVTRCDRELCQAVRIHGHFWMYWGEGEIHLAQSDDLTHWNPVTSADGQPMVLMHARPKLFDSGLPEVGPPPVLTKQGIVLLFNGKNASGQERDPELDAGTYSVGQALFRSNDPAHLIGRSEKPFFRPELAWERSGQYAAGTTFAEGLVKFHDRWFLYYGCADSYVGVAIATSNPE